MESTTEPQGVFNRHRPILRVGFVLAVLAWIPMEVSRHDIFTLVRVRSIVVDTKELLLSVESNRL